VETVIDGLAGSIASIIALAGAPVTMAPAAFYMVHEPHGVAMGPATRMRHLAGLLDKASRVLADVYVDRSSAGIRQVQEWMHDETWFTAQEALDAGFVDELLDDDPEAVAAAAQFDLSSYTRVPSQLAARAAVPPPPPAAPSPAATAPPARARERAALLSQSLGYLVGV
jgi:ATP-dependent Clp protease protease subunit